MNKKMFTLIIVIFISFCFIGIVVAQNATHDNSTDHGKTIDNKIPVKNKTIDNKNDSNKSKHNYILAQGSGSDIRFSDGFRGFMLDYSKHPAKAGDEFKRASASKAGNSNTLELAVVECYKLGLSGQIGQIMAEFIQSGSSGSGVGGAVASSHESVGAHSVVRINKNTEAVFNFEVLESVSGNESDYFAYQVSFRSVNDVNKTKNLTNKTNTTNITNATNITNMTFQWDNLTNESFLKDVYDFLLFLGDLLYGAWEPIIETLLNDLLLFIHALEELTKMFGQFMSEIQSLMDALQKLLQMLDALWKELDGILKMFAILLNLIQQIIDLINYILDLIVAIINAIIALIQQILELLLALINFIIDLINQLLALIQAILDFLKAAGSFLINVIENALIIICAFVLITIGAFVYNRIKR